MPAAAPCPRQHHARGGSTTPAAAAPRLRRRHHACGAAPAALTSRRARTACGGISSADNSSPERCLYRGRYPIGRLSDVPPGEVDHLEARRTGQRHHLARLAAEQFQRVYECRAVMAHHRARATHGQRSGNPHSMLPRRVTCLRGDMFGRGEHAMRQPKPSTPPDKAVKLPRRHPRSRKFRRSHHPS